MADDAATNGNGNNAGWMNDVQKTLAYFITVSFVILIFVWVFRPPVMAAESMAQLNQLVSTLQNLLVMAFGFFLGSTMNSKAKDDSQNRIVEKLTSTAPPGPTGPIAPLPAPTVVVAWWSKMTDAERSAISAAASNDPKVAGFVASAQTGVATPEDLADLVTKGLLTQARATAIAAT